MNIKRVLRYIRKYYDEEKNEVMLKDGFFWTERGNLLSRMGCRSLLFKPDDEQEGKSFLEYIDSLLEEEEEDMSFSISGKTLLHDIPFRMEIEREEMLSFNLSYKATQEAGPMPLNAFADSFSSLVISTDGFVTECPNLLEKIKIKEMNLQVGEYNINHHDSTYIDGIFYMMECEELRDLLELYYPINEKVEEWEIDGVFYYPSGNSSKCRLDIYTKCKLFEPEKTFHFYAADREIEAAECCIHIRTHVIDDCNFDNYLPEVQETKYVSEVDVGFVFRIPASQYKTYVLEWNLLRESGEDVWLWGRIGETGFMSAGGQANDTLLCKILGIESGSFFRYIESKISKRFFDLNQKNKDITKGEMELFCTRENSPDEFHIRNICFRIGYEEEWFDSEKYENYIDGIIREEDFLNFGEQTIRCGFASYIGIDYQENVLKQNTFLPLSNIAFPGSTIQMDPEDGRFQVMISPPIGTSYTMPDTELSDWDSGFSRLPAVDGGIKVIDFRAEGNLSTQEMQIELALDMSSLLTFSIGNLKLTVEEIEGYLNYSPQNTGLGIKGVLRFQLESSFALYLMAAYEKAEDNAVWTFEAGLYDGHIPLDEIIGHIAGFHPNIGLEVRKLQLFYATDGSYLVACGIEAAFPVLGGMAIRVEGRIAKEAQAETPDIYLAGQLEIQYFLFDTQIFLFSDGSRKYSFLVRLDDLLIEAVYETNEVSGRKTLSAEEEGGVLTVTLQNFTIGGIIKALMRVLRPNVNFRLPKPWDLLNRIGFPTVHILFDTVTKDISVTLPVDLDLLLLQIEEVGFTYVKREGMEDAEFNILIKYHSPFSIETEEDGDFYLWDAFHKPAPGIASEQERKKFEILYLGLGRRINLGIRDVQDQPLFGILDICRRNVREVDSLPAGVYDSAYGWFIGARFRVLEFLEAGLLFYDPVLYGIQAKVLNNDIVPLKGLDITIYYRKATENIGLFYANVCLPDCIRNMDFGALSITLPSIQVWLYTNGNFKVDFGFPANHDFANSFALSYGVFYGKGGFYFGYLNGDTSSKVPKTDKGCFDPVIELGIGITIGIGKKFDAGVLSLSASLELTAVFEGVFARYISYDGQTRSVYYKCCGTVVIAGEIKGEVNFYLIRAGFRLYAKAAVTAVLESGKATIVSIEAALQVKAYVKIWIIKISFSFEYTYRDNFSLGEASHMPWENENLLARQTQAYEYDWTPVTIYASCKMITMWIVPYFSKDDRGVIWNEIKGSQAAEEKRKIAMLSSYPEEDLIGFLEVMCTWAIGAQKRENKEEITEAQLRALLEEMTNDCAGFVTENLWELLLSNFSLELDKAPSSITDERKSRMEALCEAEITQIPMPLPPVLVLRWETLNRDNETYTVRVYDLSTQEYAETLFSEYFLLITKAGLQEGLSYMQKQKEESMETAALLEVIKQSAKKLSGMISRFLFCGSRQEEMPMYEAAWQEFDGLATAGREPEKIVHRLVITEKEKGQMLGWQNGMDLTVSIAEGDLQYPQNALEISFVEEPGMLPFGQKEHCPIALYDRQDIYEEDTPVASMWKPAEDIRNLGHLHIHTILQNAFCREPCDSELDYTSCFLIPVQIRREKESDIVYSVAAADYDARNQLRELLSGRYTLLESSLLFQKRIRHTSEQKPSGAWYREKAYQQDISFIRRNLSAVTTPWKAMQRNADDAACVSIENLQEAFELLNTMLEIGGEGHYIRLGKEPLPSELFEDDGQTVIGFLIRIEENAAAPIICLGAQAVGADEIPVIDNEEIEGKLIETMKADEYGFSFTLENMDTAFGQLVYSADTEISAPISMQEKEGLEENQSYYSHLFTLHPRAEKQNVIMEEQNPYTRILPEDYRPQDPAKIEKVTLRFGFRDIVGNRTAKEDDYCLKEPFPILYHDRLYQLTELPFTRISYCFKPHADSKRRLKVELRIGCVTGEGQQTVEALSGAVRQTARIYYQYGCEDVELSFRLAFGAYETQPVIFTREQKQGVCHYLEELYLYLKDKENRKPSDIMLSFLLDCPVERQTDGIVCLSVMAKVSIARDSRYVDKISAPPEAAEVETLIPVKEDMEASAAAFESGIEDAKLLQKDGIYAAFLPENTLCVTPPDMRTLFYSIPPISLKLMSRSGMLLTTVTSRILEEKEEKTSSYYNIDMEVWLLRFFRFYERLFTPDRLTVLYEEDVTAVLAGLLALKIKFAQRLSARTEGFFAATQENVSGEKAAKEALCDYLQKDIGKGYEAVGCAVYSVTQKLGGQYALDGGLKDASGICSCKFTDSDYAAFVAAPENPESRETISMEKAVYTFTHLEDRTNHQWYRFLVPFEQKANYIAVNISHYETEPVKLPVPLRQYPAMPVLMRQSAGGSSEDYKTPVWSYEIELQCTLAAQDRLHLVLNTGPEQKNGLRAADDLFQALAQFIYNEEEYEELLSGDKEEKISVTAVLQDFEKLAGHIYDCLEMPVMRENRENELVLSAEYAEGYLTGIKVSDLQLPEGISYPDIVLTDEKEKSCRLKRDESGQYYSLGDKEVKITPKSMFTMQLSFPDISLQKWQGISCRVYLRRNEVFSDVNPAFLYETPCMGFEEMIFPSLQYHTPISAGDWSVEQVLVLLQEITGFSDSMTTELLVGLGQKVGQKAGGEDRMLFRPVARRIAHKMTAETAKEFLQYVQREWQGKGLEGKDHYFVTLTIRQYPEQIQEKTEGVMLLEITDIVFSL